MPFFTITSCTVPLGQTNHHHTYRNILFAAQQFLRTLWFKYKDLRSEQEKRQGLVNHKDKDLRSEEDKDKDL